MTPIIDNRNSLERVDFSEEREVGSRFLMGRPYKFLEHANEHTCPGRYLGRTTAAVCRNCWEWMRKFTRGCWTHHHHDTPTSGEAITAKGAQPGVKNGPAGRYEPGRPAAALGGIGYCIPSGLACYCTQSGANSLTP